jgi:CRISPR-associated protein Cas2
MRRRYFVMYDIRDDGRLRRVHDVVRCYGNRFQYSVFLCDLNESELINLKWELGDVMDQTVDSVAIVDLGEPQRIQPRTFQYMGVRHPPPPDSAMVL